MGSWPRRPPGARGARTDRRRVTDQQTERGDRGGGIRARDQPARQRERQSKKEGKGEGEEEEGRGSQWQEERREQGSR